MTLLPVSAAPILLVCRQWTAGASAGLDPTRTPADHPRKQLDATLTAVKCARGSKRCTSRGRSWRASFGTYGSTPIMTSTFDASSAGKGSSRLPSYTTTSFRRAQLAARGSISVATPGPRDVQTARSWLWLRSPYRCRRPTPWTATASPPGERGTRTATGVRTHRARWPRPGRRNSRYQ